MSITLQELFENVDNPYLNTKVNNLIIYGLEIDMYYAVINYLTKRKPHIINYEEIKEEYDVVSDYLTNVSINLDIVEPKELFNEIFKNLDIKERINFESKLDILKFKKILLEYNKMIQLILYNGDNLPKEKQELLNELFDYKTYIYNVIYILQKEKNLSTYKTLSDSILDDRENFTKIKINSV